MVSSGLGTISVKAASPSVTISGSITGLGKVSYNQGTCSVAVSSLRNSLKGGVSTLRTGTGNSDVGA